MSIKQRMIRFFVLSAIGLLLGAAIAGISIFSGKQDTNGNKISFSLINHDGKPVTDKDFFGRYLLVYFGFTSCPAICPTELQKMTEAYKLLPEAWQGRIDPIFITVDPERDTPNVLKGYVDLFMPELIGLTGTPEQIDAVKKSFRVYASKVKEGDTYTMDHSSFIYYIGLDGQIGAMFKATDKPEDIKTRITELDGLD